MKRQKQDRAISDELIDEMLKHGRTADDVNGLLKQLTKAVLERALQGELTEHLGYGKHDPAGANSGNSRNGSSLKTLKGDFGEVELETPRDRAGAFEPKIIKKNQTRWTGFDEKVLSMYARGMTTREIQGHLEEMYQVEVSASLISEITDGIMDQARAWQNRPLEAFYPIVFLDALYVKMRHEGRVENRAVYVALGINLNGRKDVLGMWTSAAEGAKFWLNVLTELKNRGVKDIFLACVDGLKGFPKKGLPDPSHRDQPQSALRLGLLTHRTVARLPSSIPLGTISGPRARIDRIRRLRSPNPVPYPT
ncbi:IS256 family transposase [Paludibaculum fermentans]|uniref:Mutator family transposase n=1 Tax=Paludibaculum fermentans TaxID=1473598 RepID=A0A7S7NX53_PALFE|nr:IS256 family transposase [Paludibaculum fermentans]